MEQPPTYAWRWGSSPWQDYNYNKSTSNAEEEEHVAQSAEYVDVYSEFGSIWATFLACL